MGFIEQHQWLLPALFVLGMFIGLWLQDSLHRFWMRRRLARRWRRARRGEEQARGWLERNGFTILDEQVSQLSYLIVNGEELAFTVRADYLVEREGVRAIVEVKTGAVADPSSRGTRRQILEYAQVYGVSNVYLFDADEQRLHHIGVPAAAEALPSARWSTAAIALAFGAGIGLSALAYWLFTARR